MKLLSCLFITATILAPSFFVLAPRTVTADTSTIICENMPGNTKTDCQQAANEGTGGITGIADNVMDILWALVSAISVLVIIIAGFMYVVSAGNPDKTKRAKNAIMYAVIGLVVAFLARTIVQFILSSV